MGHQPTPAAKPTCPIPAEALLHDRLVQGRVLRAPSPAMKVYRSAMSRRSRRTEIPEQDRPREKLLANSAAALTDQELMAVLLGKGSPRMDVMTWRASSSGSSASSGRGFGPRI